MIDIILKNTYSLRKGCMRPERNDFSNHILVSIIIPVYNGANYIRDSIRSAINQTYPFIEIIVVNDGSCDNDETKNIVTNEFKTVIYLEQTNKGVYAALNYGLTFAKGEFFVWLSHDDILNERMVQSHVELRLSQNCSTNVITYNYHIAIDSNGSQIGKPIQLSFPRQASYLLTHEFPIYCCSLLTPITVIKSLGGFDERIIWADHKYLVDIASFFELVAVPETLTYMRKHSNQVTAQKKYNNIPLIMHSNDALIYAFTIYKNKHNYTLLEVKDISIQLAKKGYFLASIYCSYHIRYSVSFFSKISFKMILFYFMFVKSMKIYIKKLIKS